MSDQLFRTSRSQLIWPLTFKFWLYKDTQNQKVQESQGTFGAEPTLEAAHKKNGKSEAQPQDNIGRGVDYLRSIGQTHNINGEIGASFISDVAPFKHGLLDTLESHVSNNFLAPGKRAAPQFGSLLAQDQGFQH